MENYLTELIIATGAFILLVAGSILTRIAGVFSRRAGANSENSSRDILALKESATDLAFKPIRAFIDVAYACNLKCVMCDLFSPSAVMPYSHGKPKLMEFELFKKIIDESSPYIQNYFLQLRGEPLLHPRYVDMIAYCREKAPKAAISFNTNGQLMTPEMIRKILSIGVNNIYVSIDAATAPTYSAIRLGGDYERLISNIDCLLEERKKYNIKPSVGVSFVIQERNKGEQEEFLAYWKDKVDLIIFYAKAELDRQRPFEAMFFQPSGARQPCAQVSENLVALSDGRIVPCCGDLGASVPYGDITETSLRDILCGLNVHEFRAKVLVNDVDDIELCKSCVNWVYSESIERSEDGFKIIEAPTQKTYYPLKPN